MHGCLGVNGGEEGRQAVNQKQVQAEKASLPWGQKLGGTRSFLKKFLLEYSWFKGKTILKADFSYRKGFLRETFQARNVILIAYLQNDSLNK